MTSIADIDSKFSRLERDDDEVKLKIKTRELKPNHIYTVWWVIFNKPGACSAPGCGLDDFFLPDGSPNFAQRAATEMSAVWATGGIARHNGKAKFRAMLEENVAPGQVNFGPGLTDAEIAEFHIVIRDHGPDDQGLLYEQMHTFGGGCNNAPPFLGTPGKYECVDDQLAIHVPGNGDGDDDDD
jgi:hypothetical protein